MNSVKTKTLKAESVQWNGSYDLLYRLDSLLGCHVSTTGSTLHIEVGGAVGILDAKTLDWIVKLESGRIIILSDYTYHQVFSGY